MSNSRPIMICFKGLNLGDIYIYGKMKSIAQNY